MSQLLQLVPTLIGPLIGLLLVALDRNLERGGQFGFRQAFIEVFRFMTWWIVKPFYQLECRVRTKNAKESTHITGYKTAFLVYDPVANMVSFSPLRWKAEHTNDLHYGVDSEAKCHKNRKHQAPVLSCRCGFYALALERHVNKVLGSNPQTPSWLANSLVTLEVDLSGTVVEGKLGYRAETQRVLKVKVKQKCSVCIRDNRFWKRASKATGFAVTRTPEGLNCTSPVCDHHQGDQKTDIVALSNSLGTEVVWR